MTVHRRYPWAPLAAAMGLSEGAAGRVLGLSGSTQRDYRTLGVSELVADRLAVKAGFHPYEIWPELAHDGVDYKTCAARDCTTSFAPARRDQRYCSKPCRHRGDDRRAQLNATSERARYHLDPAKRTQKLGARRRYYAEHSSYEIARQTRYNAAHADHLRQSRRTTPEASPSNRMMSGSPTVLEAAQA